MEEISQTLRSPKEKGRGRAAVESREVIRSDLRADGARCECGLLLVDAPECSRWEISDRKGMRLYVVVHCSCGGRTRIWWLEEQAA